MWGGAVLLAGIAIGCNSSPTAKPRSDVSTDAAGDGGDADTFGSGDGEADAAGDRDVADANNATDDAEVVTSCSPPDAASLDAAAVQAGAAIPQLQACINCHGTDLSGGGLMTVNGDTQYVANLTPDPTTGLGCWTDGQIQTAILTAVANDGSELCLMPAWAVSGYQFFGPLDAGTASLIVQYLRSIPPVVNDVGDTGQTCGPDAGNAGALDAGSD
jgi:hypothetical protein